jgi:dolichyl-phosphate-mannose--protein O-mannosyl transferase
MSNIMIALIYFYFILLLKKKKAQIKNLQHTKARKFPVVHTFFSFFNWCHYVPVRKMNRAFREKNEKLFNKQPMDDEYAITC